MKYYGVNHGTASTKYLCEKCADCEKVESLTIVERASLANGCRSRERRHLVQ